MATMKVRRRPRPQNDNPFVQRRTDPRRQMSFEPDEYVLSKTSFAFDVCPRCLAMASALCSITTGDIFAIDCTTCGLPGATGIITLWDVANAAQAGNHPCDFEEALMMVHRGGIETTIWQGDVLLAHFSPIDGVHYFNGRCSVREFS